MEYPDSLPAIQDLKVCGILFRILVFKIVATSCFSLISPNFLLFVRLFTLYTLYCIAVYIVLHVTLVLKWVVLNSVQFPVKVLKFGNPVLHSCEGDEMRISMLGPSFTEFTGFVDCIAVL